MTQLILASSSVYRRELLARLRLPFDTLSPDIDESAQIAETPQQLSERLCRAKAQTIASLHPEAIVIGSDQVASLNGILLGKPGTVSHAKQQLHACSSNRVDFFTGVCVQKAHKQLFYLAHTQVFFRALSAGEIDAYLEAEKPLDCAGSFKAEGLGICLFDAITSADPTDLIGLPLIPLTRMLRHFGLDPLAATTGLPPQSSR